MSQYVRHNRMLFKIDAQREGKSLENLEKELEALKEIDANKLQIIKIPKEEI